MQLLSGQTLRPQALSCRSDAMLYSSNKAKDSSLFVQSFKHFYQVSAFVAKQLIKLTQREMHLKYPMTNWFLMHKKANLSHLHTLRLHQRYQPSDEVCFNYITLHSQLVYHDVAYISAVLCSNPPWLCLFAFFALHANT